MVNLHHTKLAIILKINPITDKEIITHLNFLEGSISKLPIGITINGMRGNK